MKFDGYRCDECGTEKRQSNHWFLISEVGDGLVLTPWPINPNDYGTAKHICGNGCVQKVVEHWMSGK